MAAAWRWPGPSRADDVGAAAVARQWARRVAAAIYYAAPAAAVVTVRPPGGAGWPHRFRLRQHDPATHARAVEVIDDDGHVITSLPPLPPHALAEALAALAREWAALHRDA